MKPSPPQKTGLASTRSSWIAIAQIYLKIAPKTNDPIYAYEQARWSITRALFSEDMSLSPNTTEQDNGGAK